MELERMEFKVVVDDTDSPEAEILARAASLDTRIMPCRRDNEARTASAVPLLPWAIFWGVDKQCALRW